MSLTEVDNDQLNTNPDTVENVVFPAKVVKTNGVDLLVENQSDLNKQVHQHETLGADVEWKNLDGVGNQKTGPGEVVSGGVDENHSNDGLSGSWVAVDSELSRAHRPNSERNKHTTSGSKEKRTTTKLVYSKGHTERNEPVVDRQTTVDLELSILAGDTDGVEDNSEVVRNQSVTGPLREQTSSHQQEKTMPVTLGGNKLTPSAGCDGLFEGNSLSDLGVLELNERILFVTIGVVLGENLEGGLWLVLGHEPPRGLRDHPKTGDLDDRGKSLHEGWGSPRPVVTDSESSIGGPGSNDSTNVPCGVVDGGDDTTVLRMAQLSEEERSRGLRNGTTEPNEETGSNEHGERGGSSLEGNTDHHEGDTSADGDTTAETIRDTGSEWKTADGSNTHDGIEQPEEPTLRVVEELLPVTNHLETVHHRTLHRVLATKKGNIAHMDQFTHPSKPVVADDKIMTAQRAYNFLRPASLYQVTSLNCGAFTPMVCTMAGILDDV